VISKYVFPTKIDIFTISNETTIIQAMHEGVNLMVINPVPPSNKDRYFFLTFSSYVANPDAFKREKREEVLKF
jgi:hypothetical protein